MTKKTKKSDKGLFSTIKTVLSFVKDIKDYGKLMGEIALIAGAVGGTIFVAPEMPQKLTASVIDALDHVEITQETKTSPEESVEIEEVAKEIPKPTVIKPEEIKKTKQAPPHKMDPKPMHHPKTKPPKKSPLPKEVKEPEKYDFEAKRHSERVERRLRREFKRQREERREARRTEPTRRLKRERMNHIPREARPPEPPQEVFLGEEMVEEDHFEELAVEPVPEIFEHHEEEPFLNDEEEIMPEEEHWEEERPEFEVPRELFFMVVPPVKTNF